MSSYQVPLSLGPFLEIINTIFSCSIEQTKCIAFRVIQTIKMTEFKIYLTFFYSAVNLNLHVWNLHSLTLRPALRQYYRVIYILQFTQLDMEPSPKWTGGPCLATEDTQTSGARDESWSIKVLCGVSDISAYSLLRYGHWASDDDDILSIFRRLIQIYVIILISN